MLKRSETEQNRISSQVTFAETAGMARNHPLHMRSSTGQVLERIDEGKSNSPSRRHGASANPLNRSSSHNKKLGHQDSQKQLQNISDISNLTINSNKLEDSVKAPNRPPVQIEGLTKFLVDSHYKWYGVMSKNQSQLLRFWKEFVSVAYRERKRRQLLLQSQNQQDGGAVFGQQSTKELSGQPMFQSKNNKYQNKDFEKYGACFEMDVAYTLQNDLEEENNEMKKTQTQQEQKVKDARSKQTKDFEEQMIRTACQLYYKDKEDYFIAILRKGTYRDNKIEERMKKWYLHVAEEKMLANGLSDLDTIRKMARSPSLSKKTGGKSEEEKENKNQQNNNSLDISKISKDTDKPADLSNNTSKTEIKSSISKTTKIKEDAAKEPEQESKEIKDKREAISKKLKKEQELIVNLMLYMRETETLTNDPTAVFRLYRDCKEKAKNGLIWHKNDTNVERVVYRYFSAESIVRRVQLVYEHKCQSQPRYKHLSTFGLYLQMKERERLLCSIEWPVVKSGRAINTAHAEESAETQAIVKKISENFKEEKQRAIPIEEMIADLEIYYKHESKIRANALMDVHKKKLDRRHEKLLEDVFGKERKEKLDAFLQEKKTMKRLQELAKPKDKWKRLRILMELKKKFRHDITLEKMIKEELKDNRVFKFPEEYDLYDDQEDKLCKHMGEKGIKVQDLGKGKTLREKFKALDDRDLYYLKKEVNQKRREERELDTFLIEKALEYLEQKKQRLSGKVTTVREFVSEVYHQISEKFKDLVKARFPHVTYGQDPNSNTYKKSYPLNFKSYFFRLVRSHFKEKKGLKRIKNPAPAFIVPSGRCRCLIHENMPCPEGCTYATFNKKVILKAQRLKKYFKEPQTFRSRVWRRRDFYSALDKVLMLNSEKENCVFEPEAGSMSRTIDFATKYNPNLRKEGLLDEADPEAFVKKLGQNFEKSHPEVYKAGVLKRAQLMVREGRFDDALKRLYEGFNVESIKKRFNPHYMQRLIADAFLKKKNERESKEREDSKVQTALSGLNRIEGLKDVHESQKKKPEEDFENKKLVSIFREAYDLITLIENRKVETEKKIKQIMHRQRSLKKSVRSFSTYKRSQTRMDDGKELILYRTIMCPLREKCPSDMRPRWPTSSTKSKTKFGQECPFAHHPMELQFPESIITKLSSSYQTIKALKSKVDKEKPKEVFKPSGALFDCAGCFQKGPCNLCRYKEMAGKSSAKFNDKTRKESLRRSMEKRESSEVKQDQKAMEKIIEELDLDENYTLKFGHLKKACVLYFYGRCNDAFDEVAKAAEIIQKQREVEKQKQSLVEKRWKFKLNIDDGFELPMPIDQIDPNKVDEKFLKKLDLQGVAVSTLKLYIEQVAPQSNEEYSKHKFLNKCIEDFYLQCESMLEDKVQTIAKMKKQVEKLDEEAEMMEAMQGMESSPEKSPEKGTANSFGDGTRRIKPKKTKMCPNLENHGKCKLSPARCPFAHNPIELDLIPVETKMKNLQGVIQSQTLKMKNMKPLEPWRPVKSGDIIHTHLMDMTSKGRKKKNADGEEEDENEGRRKEVKRKSIFDRENIKKKPYEVNE